MIRMHVHSSVLVEVCMVAVLLLLLILCKEVTTIYLCSLLSVIGGSDFFNKIYVRGLVFSVRQKDPSTKMSRTRLRL